MLPSVRLVQFARAVRPARSGRVVCLVRAACRGPRVAAFYLPLLLALGVHPGAAAEPAAELPPAPAGSALRQALAPLGPDLVTTGRLLDRAVPLAGVRDFDGAPDAPLASPARLRQVIDELARAAVGGDRADATAARGGEVRWPEPAALRDRARGPAGAGPHGRPGGGRPVEIAVVHAAYQTLRPDALAGGGLLVSADVGAPRLVPAPGARAEDLLERRRAVVASALVPRLHDGARARFVIPADLVLSDAPVDLALDLDDGRGLRRVAPGEVVATSYAATGTRTLRVRITTADGAVAWARFGLEVAALDVPAPDAVWPVTASIPFEGAAGSGDAFVLLAPGHAALADPVVVVEGFDLDDSLDWPELYTLLNQENLLEDLRAAGRDAVVLNFDGPTDPIQRNAFLLVELLALVDAALPPDATYPVVGASMGGLVCRYALAWLESEAGGHRCDLFLSFDVPHTGAVIPLGLQCWVDFFAGEADEAAYLLDRLDTPAARQMLLYHHTALSGQSAQPDPRFGAFFADLATLGGTGDRAGWPTAPRLVAVANGSGTGADQGFDPGDQVVEYEYGSFLVDIVGNIWALPDGATDVVFDGLIDLIWPLPDTERTVTVSGTLPWDGAPAGSRASFAQLDTTAVPYGDIEALVDRHAFIPSVSAVALGGADPFADLGGAGGPGDPGAFPPFDAVYLPAGNQDHIAITAESRQWFLDEVLGTVTGVGPAGPGSPGDPGAPGSPPVAAVPAVLQLHGAAPNPFNPRTEIAYAVPAAGAVRLWIADVRGRRVQTLVDGSHPAGQHRVLWDGRDATGREVAAGVYLAVVEHAGSRVATRVTVVR